MIVAIKNGIIVIPTEKGYTEEHLISKGFDILDITISEEDVKFLNRKCFTGGKGNYVFSQELLNQEKIKTVEDEELIIDEIELRQLKTEYLDHIIDKDNTFSKKDRYSELKTKIKEKKDKDKE